MNITPANVTKPVRRERLFQIGPARHERTRAVFPSYFGDFVQISPDSTPQSLLKDCATKLPLPLQLSLSPGAKQVV
jgi:hypothetical protein